MGKKALFYGTAMIVVYLAVAYSTGFTADVKGAASGSTSLIQAFQGR